jgi:peptide deformylase
MEIFKLIPPQDPRVLTAIVPFSDDMLKDTDIKDRKDLSDKMFKTMNKYSGLGLSANQCGLPFRMFVMGDNLLLENRRKITAFNPKIIEKLPTDLRYKEQVLMKEGCLTFPFLFLNINRPRIIEVEYEDIEGKLIKEDLDAMFSRIFQHEYDHMQGIVFTDRVSKLKLDMAKKKQMKMIKEYAKKVGNHLTTSGAKS